MYMYVDFSQDRQGRLVYVRAVVVATCILCTISLAISYVSHLFCAHLCVVPINFNYNDENRILGK